MVASPPPPVGSTASQESNAVAPQQQQRQQPQQAPPPPPSSSSSASLSSLSSSTTTLDVKLFDPARTLQFLVAELKRHLSAQLPGKYWTDNVGGLCQSRILIKNTKTNASIRNRTTKTAYPLRNTGAGDQFLQHTLKDIKRTVGRLSSSPPVGSEVSTVTQNGRIYTIYCCYVSIVDKTYKIHPSGINAIIYKMKRVTFLLPSIWVTHGRVCVCARDKRPCLHQPTPTPPPPDTTAPTVRSVTRRLTIHFYPQSVRAIN